MYKGNLHLGFSFVYHIYYRTVPIVTFGEHSGYVGSNVTCFDEVGSVGVSRLLLFDTYSFGECNHVCFLSFSRNGFGNCVKLTIFTTAMTSVCHFLL